MTRKTILLFALSIMSVLIVQAQESIGYLEAQSVYRAITVDGNIADWDGIQPACTDAVGDGGLYYDFQAAYLANDNDNFYIRLTFAEPEPYGSFFWYMNIGFDNDLDPSTGHRWLSNFGSEFNIQGRQVFDQRCGDWVCTINPASEDNLWGTFAYANVEPMNDANVKDIEISIRRDLVYKNMEDGQPGLSNPDESPLFDPKWNNFVLMFETEDENYQSVEWMPDPDPDTNEIGVFYTFALPPASVNSWELH